MSLENSPNNEAVAKDLKPFVFNQQEVLEIRRSLSGEDKISEKLLEKVQKDPLVGESSVSIFFPAVTEHILETGENPKVVAVRTGVRDRAMMVGFKDDSYMIKSIENSQEPEVAKTVAEIGVGPKQFESVKGYITEKFIEGKAINEIDPNECTSEYMEDMGHKIGNAIKKVHEQNILINDQLLADDFGKSHTIINSEGEINFIDFGASVDLTDFPNLSDEQVYLIIKSDAMASMKLGMISQKDMPAFIDNYRRGILSEFQNKEEVFNRYDGQLLSEGFYFLSQKLPNVSSLVKGYREETES